MIWVVRRPVATWMITIALLVFGLVSYQRLALNLMPDLSYPTVTIRTEAEGYAPAEVEDQISQRIEEAVATTQGIVRMESRSRAGRSEVLLSFRWGTDINSAMQDVRERLQRVFFDADVQRPLLLRYDPSLDPILRLSLAKDPRPGQSSALSLSELRSLSERQIKRDLEALDGVAAVRIRGGMEQEIQILLKEEWMAARKITIDNVTQTLRAENINLPGGSILEGEKEFLVRTLNAFSSMDDLKELKIRRSDGVEVELTEIAELKEGYKDRMVLSRINGREAVELEVYKAADANIVQVAEQIKQRLFEGTINEYNPSESVNSIQENLPDDVELTLLEDQARFIEAALNNLRSTALLGGSLAMIILFLFLRDFRATAIISAAIPLSIIVTFAPMFIGDISLNLMSLGGLALGIGMLVDNAVVVLENIQVHIERGEDRKTAASKGTKEVAMAVITSTMTTISVFLPITFVEGAAGQIFGDLSLTVVYSLLASLAVALFFVPMLASSELSLRAKDSIPSFRSHFTAWVEFKSSWQELSGWKRWLWIPWGLLRFLMTLTWEIAATLTLYPLVGLMWVGVKMLSWSLPFIGSILLNIAHRFYRIFELFEQAYSSLLSPALKRTSTVLLLASLAFILTLPVLSSLGQRLLPEVDQGRFSADINLPIGTPLGKTSAALWEAEQDLLQLPGLSYLYSIVGSDSRIDDRSGAGEHSARLMVGLEPNLPKEQEAQLMENVRARLLEVPNSQSIQLQRPALFTFSTPLELVLYSKDLTALKSYSSQLLTLLSNTSGLSDAKSSLSAGYPEIQIVYDREKLRRLGLNASAVAQMVRDKVQGTQASRISTDNQRLDLTVRLTEGARRGQQQLKRININPAVNPPIPLSAVADLIEAEGPSEIRRLNQQRAVVLEANIEGFDLSGPSAHISNELSELNLSGASWELAGQSQEMSESLGAMQQALYLAVFLVYVIMASSFESLLHPLVILFSIPLALIGAVFGLWGTGFPLSVIVFIGAIVLAGVVVNNAIVLVDTINRKRAEGSSIEEATEAASKLRLRPILITTLTTTLGLLPLAFGYGEGAEVQQPLAITIITGLLSSTLLTLLVIPAIYLRLSALFSSKELPTEELET